MAKARARKAEANVISWESEKNVMLAAVANAVVDGDEGIFVLKCKPKGRADYYAARLREEGCLASVSRSPLFWDCYDVYVANPEKRGCVVQ